jgi:hypothetical protein
MIQYHNVNTQGLPSEKIVRVPTLISKNGKFLVGKEVKAWLESLLPQEIENCTLGGCYNSSTLDGAEDDSGDYFNLNNYGQSLQPVITQTIQDKINRNVSDAFSNGNKD